MDRRPQAHLPIMSMLASRPDGAEVSVALTASGALPENLRRREKLRLVALGRDLQAIGFSVVLHNTYPDEGTEIRAPAG